VTPPTVSGKSPAQGVNAMRLTTGTPSVLVKEDRITDLDLFGDVAQMIAQHDYLAMPCAPVFQKTKAQMHAERR
jgi:hypothetical protein